ncbi:MAG TPA: hypothetical protein VKV05_06040 [Terriglobales bacterium]|nr:hypothetical protein [Terriglobales bacterium]
MLHYPMDESGPANMARVLTYLRQKLHRRYSCIDEHLLEENIEDALLHHQRCPQTFDASRRVALFYYLEWWMRHYLDKRLQKMNRRGKHEKAVGVWATIFEKMVSEVKVIMSIYIEIGE